ncbi:unnamed protein product [Rotaria sp. Silwood1]|nr:unnamed protein product [Rotaria sp. Silwood1]
MELQLGCVAVLNRNQHEIDQNISFDEMKKREEFFIKHQEAFQNVPDELKGSEQLVQHLATIQQERIRSTFPHIIKELRKQIAEKKARLKKIPASMNTEIECWTNFQSMINAYRESIHDNVKGEYDQVASMEGNEVPATFGAIEILASDGMDSDVEDDISEIEEDLITDENDENHIAYHIYRLQQSSCYEFQPSLGQQYIQFPTSTNNSLAQEHFILGLGYLHNFLYSLAFEQFQQAYSIDSEFAMAYVFSSLTNSEPVWLSENPEEGWKQIKLMNSKIHFENLTQREQLYVIAVRKFYDQGNIHYDDYINVLKQIYQRFPTDNEAGLFLVCILFSKTQPEIRGYLKRNPNDRQLQIDILKTILKNNPNHPGALHYSIHVYDEPQSALFVLSNAIQYSRIAPSSPHAQHMPTHIYLRLGLYKETLIGNLESDEVGANLGANSAREYHSLAFMHYTYLNMGRRSIALEILESIKILFSNGTYYQMQYGIMYDRHIIETQDYTFAFNNSFDLIVCSECISMGDILWLNQINSGLLLVKGFSTVKNDKEYKLTVVQEYIQQLTDMSIKLNKTFPTLSTSILAMKFQLQAFHEYYRIAITYDEKNIALNYAKMATELELSVNPPAYGPPIDPVKPSQELYGELLLEQQQYEKAINEFLNVMTYFPNRTLTLLGLARAYSSLNRTDLAYLYYSRLINDMLYNSDFGLQWYVEAYDYLATHLEKKSDWNMNWNFVEIIIIISFVIVIIVTLSSIILVRKYSCRNHKYDQSLN